jgi:hypothetical protein
MEARSATPTVLAQKMRPSHVTTLSLNAIVLQTDSVGFPTIELFRQKIFSDQCGMPSCVNRCQKVIAFRCMTLKKWIDSRPLETEWF